MELAGDLKGWTLAKTKDGTKIYKKKEEGSPIYLIRGDSPEVPATVDEVLEFTNHVENLALVDEMIIKGTAKFVEHFDEMNRIIVCAFKLPFPMSPREFVWFEHRRRLSDGTGVILAYSTVHPDCPERKGFVRGEIRESGYVIRPLQEDKAKCTVHYIVQVDPKGMIPTWIVNLASTSQGLNAKRLCDIFVKGIHKTVKKTDDDEKRRTEENKNEKIQAKEKENEVKKDEDQNSKENGNETKSNTNQNEKKG